MQTLKIAQWGQIHSLYLPLYIADKKGFFADEGLRLELSLAGNDDQTFDYVASSRADFGVGDPSFCAMKNNESVQARVVSTVVNRTGVWGITRNPVIPTIASEADLVNLRIGSLPAPATAYALIRSLKEQNKRLLKSMRIIEAPIGEQFSLLSTGDADIVLDIEPFISIAESKGCRVNYSMAKIHGPYTFTGLYTRNEFIERKPEVVQGTVRALGKALSLLYDDSKVGIEVSRQIFPGLDEDILTRSLRRLKSERVWKRSAKTDINAWKNSIEVRQRIGDRFSQEILNFVDNRFINS